MLPTLRPIAWTGRARGATEVANAWGARRLEPLLFEVSPGNPAVFVLAAGALLVIGLGASALPAWRATRVDPRESLAVE